MKIERLLQINIAALTVIGTLLLGLGQPNPLLPVLSLFAAATSIYFTDILGWFRLHRVIANLAALAALFISMREFDVFGGNSSSQLRAIANLLVYLQFVLLYQEKNQRIYWQLAVLSLLQVVVAAALDLRLGLGLLLVVYMVTALSAMSLLFIFSHSEALTAKNGVREATGRGNCRFLGTPMAAPVRLRQASEVEIRRWLLGWRFMRRLIGIGASTWILALVVFFVTPRMGNAVWRGAQHGGTRTVGFSREIRLGEMGEILQNNATAMRLKVFDREGRVVTLTKPPYIRGAALSVYQFERNQGKWSQPYPPRSWRQVDLQDPPNDNWVETSISLEPTGSAMLFSIAPAYRAATTPKSVDYDLVDEQLVRNDVSPLRSFTESYRYTAATTGIRGGRQLTFWPRRPYPNVLERHFERVELPRLVEWDRRRFAKTAEIAAQVIEENGATPSDPYRAAKALEAYFLRPGRFTYTLDQRSTPPRPPQVDPIEHFVVTHGRGHCEYFASALTIMLRSQNIPARVVVGYRGGEFNKLGGYYHIRQKDAHSWVEVYLKRSQIPEAMLSDVPADAPGIWLRLDPTPAAEQTFAEHRLLTPISDAASFLEALWNDYVLGLNSMRQKEAIYQPLMDRARRLIRGAEELGASLMGGKSWRTWLRSWVEWFGMDQPDAQIPWRTLGWFMLLASSIVLLAVSGWRTLEQRNSGRTTRRWRFPWNPFPGEHVDTGVGFYHRAERLLARRRFHRQRHQTQREFIHQVGMELASDEASCDTPRLLERIVDAFYRVRFGKHPLDRAEAEAIENALTQLEQTLAKPHS